MDRLSWLILLSSPFSLLLVWIWMQSLEVQQPFLWQEKEIQHAASGREKEKHWAFVEASELPTMHQTITSKPLSSKSLLWCFSFLLQIDCFVTALTSATQHNLTQCCLFPPFNTFFPWQSWYHVLGFSDHFSFSSFARSLMVGSGRTWWFILLFILGYLLDTAAVCWALYEAWQVQPCR